MLLAYPLLLSPTAGQGLKPPEHCPPLPPQQMLVIPSAFYVSYLIFVLA